MDKCLLPPRRRQWESWSSIGAFRQLWANDERFGSYVKPLESLQTVDLVRNFFGTESQAIVLPTALTQIAGPPSDPLALRAGRETRMLQHLPPAQRTRP